MLRALENLGSQSLSHAASHADNRVLLHPALHFAKTTDHPLFGVIANRAGVQENDVSIVRSIGLVIAGRDHFAKHKLGVADIHLAAVGLNINRWASGFGHSAAAESGMALS